VLDSPDGDDACLRPNQIFAVLLPGIGIKGYAPLLTTDRQRGIVDTCGRSLLTSVAEILQAWVAIEQF
jgi:hypothetical protein